MSIDLTSRLSAIATDSSGKTYVVWVEANRLWCAIYDTNSATWKNATEIAEIGTKTIKGLNLIFDESLIQQSGAANTNLPGLAVIYQQGSDNDSNFYYTAAKYDVNGNLQWLDTPQALTSDQVGDLEPQVIAYQKNGETSLFVVGQKVNIEKSSNLGVQEDTDLYYETFSINSNQFATSTTETNPDATYAPQTSKNGVIQGNLYAYPGQSATAPNAVLTSTFSTTANSSNYNGLGFNWNASQAFDTNLLEFNILNKAPDTPNGILGNIFKTINISGILQGSSGNNPEFTLFGGGVDTTGALLNAIASIGYQNNKNGENGSAGNDFQGTFNNKFSASVFLSTLYSYATSTDINGNYPLNNETGSLGLSVGINLPLVDYPPFFINFLGSVGVTLQWQLSPIDSDTFKAPLAAILSPTGDGAGLLTGVIAIPPIGATAAIALALSSDVSEIIEIADGSLTNSQLQLDSLLLGIPVSVGAELGIKIPFLLQLSGSGKVFVDGTFGQTLGTSEETFTLGFPLSLTLKLLGFLGGTVEIFPSWTWPTPPSSNVSLNSVENNDFFLPASTSLTTNNITASVTGSLLTLNFGTTLNTSINPNPAEFIVSVINTNGNTVNIPVFDVVVQENSVILRLEQTIPYSTLNDQTFSNITVSYNPSNAPLEDSNGQEIAGFTDLTVTNNSPQTFVYTYNPTLGNSEDYSTANSQPVVSQIANDLAQDSEPALALTKAGDIIIAWSSDTPPLKPISALTNGDKVYLTFADSLNNQLNQLPNNSQFFLTVNGEKSDITISNVDLDENTLILNLSSSIEATDSVQINYQLTRNVNNYLQNLNLTDTTNTVLWVPDFSETVTFTTADTVAPQLLLAGGLSNLLTLTFDQILETSNIPNGSQFTVFANNGEMTVEQVNINATSVTLRLSQSIHQGDVMSVSYTTVSQRDNNLSNTNGVVVDNFSTTHVITTATNPGNVVKIAHQSNRFLASVPGTTGLNFDIAAAFDPNTSTNLLVWVHADEVDLPPLSIPGQIYTPEQTNRINDSLAATDIYYSVLDDDGNWTVAAPLVLQQLGQDTNVTLGQGPNGQLMAAWLNNQTDSHGEVTTQINWSSWDGTTWTIPQILFSDTVPDPATDLSISAINNQPAVFWTNTQPSSYGDRVLDQNPLLYLRLGDWQGTTAKNSGQLLASANGTYNGNFTLRQMGALEDPTTQSGDFNPAVLFTGGNVTLNTAIPISNQGFTVEFWFKLPSLLSEGESLNLAGMAGVFALTLEGLATGTALTFTLANDAGSTVQSLNNDGQGLQTEEWYYVAGTYDDSNQLLTLYLNGSPVGSLSNVSFADLPSSGTLVLAGSAGSVYLDEVAFYNTVLTYTDVRASEVTAANLQNLTGMQLVQLLSGANQIGNHYDAQYVTPLPPGPQTHYSVWDATNQTWQGSAQIDPWLQPIATTLADARNPVWDIVAGSPAEANGTIFPNGNPDSIFQVNLTGQQTETLVGITLNANGQTYSIGQDQSGNPLNGNQLGVLLGDKLLNSLNPDGANFSHQVLGAEEIFSLFADGGGDNNGSVTFYFANNNTPLSLTAIAQPNDGNSVAANGTDLSGTTVIGIATVTEANDSSLSLIDSGFVIATNNPAIGSVLASAFNSDGSLAYVAVGNRGYTDSQGNPLNGGTVQILFSGGDVLTDRESNPLTTTNLTGNPGGVLITGLADTGTANKNVSISLATGDIDGDGIDDLVIGDANANSGTGAIYVFYGSYLTRLNNQTIDVSQLSETPSNQGFVVNGLDPDGLAGFAVAVGNFNGDGYADIVFGAPLASNGAGKVYIVYGFAQASSTGQTPDLVYTGQTFNIPNPQNSGQTVTVGEGAGFSLEISHYRSGSATTFSGSITTDDLIIGAPGYQRQVTNQWNGKGGLPTDSQSLYPDTSWVATGAVHVLSSADGSLQPFASYVGSDQPGANGVAVNYFVGTALSSADLDGDGRQDLAITAPGVNSNTGAIFVVSGATLSTSTAPQDLSQMANLVINGGLTGSKTGTVITSPGDLNDDGYLDFLITAPQAGNGAGQNYVLFGPLSLDQVGTVFDLNVTASDNKTTFLLNGSEPLQLTGTAAIAVGDINDDGFDDLMLTAPNAQQAYAVFGHPWLADNGSLKLADISADNGFVVDGLELDLTPNGNLVSVLGDINGDGFADIFSGGSDGGIIIFGGSTKSLIDNSLNAQNLTIVPDGFDIDQVLSLGDTNGDGLPELGIVGSNNLLYLILGKENLGSVGSISLSESSPNVATVISVGNVGGVVNNFSGNGYSDFVSSIPAPYQAILQPNGQLIVQNDSGETTYTSNYTNGGSFLALAGNSAMDNFGVLGVTSGLNNGSSNELVGYSLVVQPDQNLVLYEIYSNGNQASIWASNTSTSSPASSDSIFLTMQADGNLVLSAGGGAPWVTNTNGDASDGGPNGQGKTPALPGAQLALFSDGTLGLIQYQETKDESGYALVFVIHNGTAPPYNGGIINISNGVSGQPVPSKDQFIFSEAIYTYLPSGDVLTANSSDSLLYSPSFINQVRPVASGYPYFTINNNEQGALNLTTNGALALLVNNQESASFTSSTEYPYSSNDPQSSLSGNQILVPVQGLDTLAAAPSGSQIQLFLGGESPLSQSSGNATFANANNLGALTGVGDLDGDGYGDLVAGYGQASLATTGTFTYNSTVSLIAGNGAAQLAVTTSDNGSSFRDPTCFISSLGGDINGDGLADLLVSSPILQVGTIAQVFAGNTNLNGIFSNQPLLTINYNLFSVNVPALTSPVNITAIADVNADGYDDLLVSLPNFVDPSDTSGGQKGIAYVIFGSSTPHTVELNPDANNPNQSLFTNPELGFTIAGLPASNAGYAISGGQDINGDGFADFMMGAPGNNDNLSYVLFGSDFNHTVNQTGTIGNDVMVGTTTGESFVGGEGDDRIYSNGGIDVVYGAQGNDFITVNDTYFRRIDGGTGLDTLKFTGYNGQDWDLTVLSPGQRLRNLEVLDLRNYGANTLTLNALTITALSSNNQLTVFLDDQDSLNLSSDFTDAGTIYQSNQRFYRYESNDSAAILLVNQLLGQATYQLVLNSQGSLLLLSPTGETVWTATDGSGNTITGAKQALMQTDGNFVLYDAVQPVNQPGPPSAALWATGTEGNEGAYLRLESNGSLVVVSGSSPDTILQTLYAGTTDTSTASSNFYQTQQLLVNQRLTVFENNVNLTAPVTNQPSSILPEKNSFSSASAMTSSVGAITSPISSTTNLNSVDEPTQLFITNPVVTELSGKATFNLQRTGNLDKYVLVSYQTQDGSGKAGDRYLPVAGRVLFSPNETEKNITVKIPNDERYTGDRQFGLLVSLLKEGNDLTDFPCTFNLEADANGEQIRRWNYHTSNTQNGLLEGILQFNTTVTNGDAKVNLTLQEIDDFNSFYSYNSQTSNYEELMFNGKTGANFYYGSDLDKLEPPKNIQLILKDGERGDVDSINNGLIKSNGYAGRTIPGLITNNNQTFWAPTTADGLVQWRLINTPHGEYELGWIPVDNQNGMINGLAPTDIGYEAAALARKQIVFQNQSSSSTNALTRTLAQESFTNPSSLAQTEKQFFGNVKTSNLTASQYYMLYSTKDSQTTFSVLDIPEVQTDSRGYHQLSFNGVTAEISSSTLFIPGFLNQTVSVEASLSRAADYNNLITLYKVDSLTGGLDTNGDKFIDFQPGDQGYAQAALERAINPLTGVSLITPKNLGTTQQTINLLGNNMYGMVMIPNGTIEQALSQNPSNNPNLGPVALFSFGSANPDNISHLARLGSNLFGFEDLVGGGDSDYNDMILQIKIPSFVQA